MIKIVIADDHAIVREGLKRIVSAADDMELVGEAADGTEVMQGVRELTFDVLMLDLSMPGRSGMELIKRGSRRKAQAAHSGAEHAPGTAIRGACHQFGRQRLPH